MNRDVVYVFGQKRQRKSIQNKLRKMFHTGPLEALVHKSESILRIPTELLLKSLFVRPSVHTKELKIS